MTDPRDLRFEWDEAKAGSNFEKHGLSFQSGADVFFDPNCTVIDASRTADGEVRRKAFGTVDGQLVAVVHTVRGNTVRLISVRRARQKEVRGGDRSIHT